MKNLMRAMVYEGLRDKRRVISVGGVSSLQYYQIRYESKIIMYSIYFRSSKESESSLQFNSAIS